MKKVKLRVACGIVLIRGFKMVSNFGENSMIYIGGIIK